jgi:hypothetical protein
MVAIFRCDLLSGFGYSQDNLSILKFHDNSTFREIKGTNFERTADGSGGILLNSSIDFGRAISLINANANDFLSHVNKFHSQSWPPSENGLPPWGKESYRELIRLMEDGAYRAPAVTSAIGYPKLLR